MSDPISTYTFLPWLRQGLANNISSTDKTRATIKVGLSINGTGVGNTQSNPLQISKNIALYGPGDIIGIESSVIVKTEPRNWITNFEPNYLPYIEFYDEDFPWRYTPATPGNNIHQLSPWIMLVVLKEDEFVGGEKVVEGQKATSGEKAPDSRFPYITLSADPQIVFPKADQLWAWAHVHINKDIVQDPLQSRTDNTSVVILPRLDEVVTQTPDLAYSRILCPRRLEENTAYHAFLIPVYESGRLAGLGLDPDKSPAEVNATFSAWATYPNKPSEKDFPYYHRWYFRTGTVGDFEYLVRLLQHKPVDNRVGQRDIDVRQPMTNFPGITDPDGLDDKLKLGGILKLGGALQIPSAQIKDKEEYRKYEDWAIPYPHEFQERLATFINLTDEYSQRSSQQANTESGLDVVNDPETGKVDPDPLITPPIYGRWHAMVTRLLHERDNRFVPNHTNWVHDLNLDPRWRVAAGFGTKVVQDRQEEYMDAAWGQVGEIIEANRRIQLAELAKQASLVWYRDHLQVSQTNNLEQALYLTAPLQKRILSQNKTVYHQFKTSFVPLTVVSPAMRRLTRPRGRLMRALEFDVQIHPDNLINRINIQQVTPLPPKQVPEDLPTLNDVVADVRPNGIPGYVLDWLMKYPWVQYIPLFIILFVLLILFIIGFNPAFQTFVYTLIAAMLGAYGFLQRVIDLTHKADSILPENQRPEIVTDLPKNPNFRVTNPDSGVVSAIGATDSAEAHYYKEALQNSYELVQDSIGAAYQPLPVALNISALVVDIFANIHPNLTLPRYVFASVKLPDRIQFETGESFKPAMVYPEIDTPMYKPLINLSVENFLPNINYIEQNSVSILETNQKFIESYMVGLNHEFARELLWREYPTDQRGSYFRQFWDVSSYLDKDSQADPMVLREKLRDIPPLDTWAGQSDLGKHNHRKTSGNDKVVLVIRGELLKKYPTAVIYAHKAKWQRKADGTIDNTQPRDFDDSISIEEGIKTPLYEAKVEPDIYFFGFDFTIDEAKGGSGENAQDEPGWFFVIKERPGEPRFGLDIQRDKSKELQLWNDLAWTDVLPDDSNGQIIDVSKGAFAIFAPPAGEDEVTSQQREDSQIRWGISSNSAEMAYIFYQIPVMVGVHAAEMLAK